MNKPENMFPCEIGRSCDGCDASRCPLISIEHRKAILEEQKMQKWESAKRFSDKFADGESHDDYD
jgi:hypothetical protein